MPLRVRFNGPLWAILLVVGPLGAVEPKRLSLTVTNHPLDQVAEEVRRQTGTALDLSRADSARVTLTLDRQPFWTALEVIGTASRHRVEVRGSRILLLPLEPGQTRPPSVVAGAFRLVLRKVASRLDLDTGRGDTQVALDVHWEPSFRAYLIDSQPTLTEVADDQGRALTLPEPIKGRVSAGAGLGTSLTATVPRVPRIVSKLSKLAGRFTVVGADGMLEAHLDGLDQRQLWSEPDSDVSVRLDRFTPRSEDVWVAEVVLSYGGRLPEFESFQGWLPENRAFVQKKGSAKRYPANGFEIDVRPNQTWKIAYRFRDVPLAGERLSDWRLVYSTPRRIVEVPVTFQFTDVPLP